MILGSPASAAASSAATITLQDALQAASRNAPEVGLSEADLAISRAKLKAAGVSLHNPEIGAEAGLRSTDSGSGLDLSFSASQTFELGDKREHRLTVARKVFDGASHDVRLADQRIAAKVRRTFALAVRARDRLDLTRRRAQLSAQLEELMRRRLEAGAATQLDLNLSLAEAGLADRQVALAEGSYRSARSELAASMGMDPLDPPAPAGALPPVDAPLTSALELLRNIETTHPALVAAAHTAEAARARIRLEEAVATPDITIGSFLVREGDEAFIVGGRVSVPLTLFDKNQGGIAQAGAVSARADAVLVQIRLRIRGSVAVAHARATSASIGLEQLQARVIGTLEESLRLLGRAFEAGGVGLAEVVVFRRELLTAHKALIDARVDAFLAHTALDLAAGVLVLPARADRGGAR
jgi:cobalt-zinc-cadmium efflux system outer membrane protein